RRGWWGWRWVGWWGNNWRAAAPHPRDLPGKARPGREGLPTVINVEHIVGAVVAILRDIVLHRSGESRGLDALQRRSHELRVPVPVIHERWAAWIGIPL